MAIVQIKKVISEHPMTIVLKWKDTETGAEYSNNPADAELRIKKREEFIRQQKIDAMISRNSGIKPKKVRLKRVFDRAEFEELSTSLTIAMMANHYKCSETLIRDTLKDFGISKKKITPKKYKPNKVKKQSKISTKNEYHPKILKRDMKYIIDNYLSMDADELINELNINKKKFNYIIKTLHLSNKYMKQN